MLTLPEVERGTCLGPSADNVIAADTVTPVYGGDPS